MNEVGQNYKMKGTEWKRIAVVCELAERKIPM